MDEIPFLRKRKMPQIGGKKSTHKTQNKPDRSDYDHKWEKFSKAYRRDHPFCRFCEQEGYETSMADSVDHIIPLEDGGEKYDEQNLQSLCNSHHYGLKARLQGLARKLGRLDLLTVWCSSLERRPKLTERLQIGRKSSQ